ncbi:hypothetical protein FJ960_26075 [Mesorhizobium sp. B2-3-11]|uniref:PGN_0703 family putative restriction endonuclease n=1 Tax=Mesorhizobium sp. B2-3-11 TaxID=2589953 RepID=UPI00112BF76C|nr:hypothetical protein [Mesorhizobium sp. B2-3-11]TPL96408.1 hypothetical protein FJ960_26075 [Mesorhizobium sp. B2-3-11]
MSATSLSVFLPGVPIDKVLGRLANAGGNEIQSGKLTSPESSAALAVNTFGWFVERPHLLPPFPRMDASQPPTMVEVEYCARFPWSGGRHPWLDAFVETPACIIGVESKRFEPFRDKKTVSLSPAYDRPVWGSGMRPFELLRDRLRTGEASFAYVDAAQLVKHAFGLVTESNRKGRPSVLLYIFAEPMQLGGRNIDQDDILNHRKEVQLFSNMVAGAAVHFVSCSYREWLATWPTENIEVQCHAQAVLETFRP